MLRRKAYGELLKWKRETKGKALCVTGARQIGKTTLIREFGKNEYENFAEINFVRDENAKDIFKGNFTAESIITNLTAYLRVPLKPKKTLILFDEVQECTEVRSAIKFLVEDGRFDYIESGSLLGIKYYVVHTKDYKWENAIHYLPVYIVPFFVSYGGIWVNSIIIRTKYLTRQVYFCIMHRYEILLFIRGLLSM